MMTQSGSERLGEDHLSSGGFGGWKSFRFLVVLWLFWLPQSNADELIQLEIRDDVFQLEIAADPMSRFRGLSDREQMDQDRGMLFVFPRPVDSAFVMRRCLFPIDVVFLDREGEILAVHAMTVEPYGTPERELTLYPSGPGMRYAIELVGGKAAELELQVGATIELTDEIRGIRSY